eukprot:scaffold7246_cov410-Prasinococcus_capsulatus_cf.AAC.10
MPTGEDITSSMNTSVSSTVTTLPVSGFRAFTFIDIPLTAITSTFTLICQHPTDSVRKGVTDLATGALMHPVVTRFAA